jgi:hypothetical protein
VKIVRLAIVHVSRKQYAGPLAARIGPWEDEMRTLFVAAMLLVGWATPSQAQVGIQFTSPGVSIGINVPVYPSLQPVPGYPVYYDPRASSNYFFYDGYYWVFARDTWYASGWYNGPWHAVTPEHVPLYVLRIPVRYYRRPPAYFHGWSREAPPRWGEHWGRGWEEQRRGWDRWDHRAVPPPAPLPRYQRHYAGERYPREPERRHAIRSENYHHEQREPIEQPHQQGQQRGGHDAGHDGHDDGHQGHEGRGGKG